MTPMIFYLLIQITQCDNKQKFKFECSDGTIGLDSDLKEGIRVIMSSGLIQQTYSMDKNYTNIHSDSISDAVGSEDFHANKNMNNDQQIVDFKNFKKQTIYDFCRIFEQQYDDLDNFDLNNIPNFYSHIQISSSKDSLQFQKNLKDLIVSEKIDISSVPCFYDLSKFVFDNIIEFTTFKSIDHELDNFSPVNRYYKVLKILVTTSLNIKRIVQRSDEFEIIFFRNCVKSEEFRKFLESIITINRIRICHQPDMKNFYQFLVNNEDKFTDTKSLIMTSELPYPPMKFLAFFTPFFPYLFPKLNFSAIFSTLENFSYEVTKSELMNENEIELFNTLPKTIKSLKFPIIKNKINDASIKNTAEIINQYKELKLLELDGGYLLDKDIKTIINKLPLEHLIIHLKGDSRYTNNLELMFSDLSLKLTTLTIKYKDESFLGSLGDIYVGILNRSNLKVALVLVDYFFQSPSWKGKTITEINQDYDINILLKSIDLTSSTRLSLYNLVFTKEKMILFDKLKATTHLDFHNCVFENLGIDWELFGGLNMIFLTLESIEVYKMEINSDMQSFLSLFRNLRFIRVREKLFIEPMSQELRSKTELDLQVCSNIDHYRTLPQFQTLIQESPEFMTLSEFIEPKPSLIFPKDLKNLPIFLKNIEGLKCLEVYSTCAYAQHSNELIEIFKQCNMNSILELGLYNVDIDGRILDYLCSLPNLKIFKNDIWCYSINNENGHAFFEKFELNHELVRNIPGYLFWERK